MPRGRVVLGGTERHREARWTMAGSELEILIINDARGGYLWRIRQPSGATVAYSAARYPDKAEVEREVWRLREDEYPGARVRDLTARA